MEFLPLFAQVLVNSALSHNGQTFNQGDRTELPLKIAQDLEKVKLDPAKSQSLGVVTILELPKLDLPDEITVLSTIVELDLLDEITVLSTIVEAESDETVPNPAKSEDSGAKKKKATKAQEENE